MKTFFKLIRSFSRLRRKFFGKTLPHWLIDLLRLMKYANFVKLIPTLTVMTFRPTHFYRSLPAVISGKKRIYSTPVAFTAQSVLLILLLEHLAPDLSSHSALGQSVALELLYLISPEGIFSRATGMVPVVIVGLGVWVFLLGKVRKEEDFQPSLQLIGGPHIANIYLVKAIYLPSTYRYQNWPLLFWGLIYFLGLYLAYVTVLLTIVASFHDYYVMAILNGVGIYYKEIALALVVFAAISPLVLNWLVQFCIMVTYSSRVTTPCIALSHFDRLACLLEIFCKHAEKNAHYYQPRYKHLIQAASRESSKLLAKISHEFARVRSMVVWLEIRHARLSPDEYCTSQVATMKALLMCYKASRFRNALACAHVSELERKDYLRRIYLPMVNQLREAEDQLRRLRL